MSLGSQHRDQGEGAEQQASFGSSCVTSPGGVGGGRWGPSGTHVEGTQDVERGPNAQVVDGAQDERHDEGADAIALGEQGRDGEADEDRSCAGP